MEHILLLHGALGAASTLEPLKKELLPFYQVHSFNFSGHGGSEIPQAGFSIELFTQDVLAYLDQQQLPAVHIFGYSMGGYVALYLAKLHPEKVKSIFTLATKFNWSPATAEKEIRLLNPEKIQEKVPHFAKALAERHDPQDWKENMIKTADLMQQLGQTPSLPDDDLAQINVPVQVGVGDGDPMVSLEETIKTYRLLPDAKLLVLPATKHPIEVVSVSRLQYEIKEFINGLSDN